MFSAFSWPQARLSGLSATHCVAVTCGKRQPEPASQLLVATWKSSVHFLPSVCVCIINSVSLCELSIMYLNTCPSVNDVLRCAHTMAAVPAPTAPCTAAAGGRGGGRCHDGAVVTPRVRRGVGCRDPVAMRGSAGSQPAGSVVKSARGGWRGAAGRMGTVGTRTAPRDPHHRLGCARGHQCPTPWMLAPTSLCGNATCRCAPEGPRGEACTRACEASTHVQEVGGQRGRRRLDGRGTARRRARGSALWDANVAREAPVWLPGAVWGALSPRGPSRASPPSHRPGFVCSTQHPGPHGGAGWCCPSRGGWGPPSLPRPGDGDIRAGTGLGNTTGLGSCQCNQ